MEDSEKQVSVSRVPLNDGLGARLTKCLKRIAEGKSKPDFNAVCKLDDLGYIKISGTSDEVSIELTNKGINYLASNDKLRGAL